METSHTDGLKPPILPAYLLALFDSSVPMACRVVGPAGGRPFLLRRAVLHPVPQCPGLPALHALAHHARLSQSTSRLGGHLSIVEDYTLSPPASHCHQHITLPYLHLPPRRPRCRCSVRRAAWPRYVPSPRPSPATSRRCYRWGTQAICSPLHIHMCAFQQASFIEAISVQLCFAIRS